MTITTVRMTPSSIDSTLTATSYIPTTLKAVKVIIIMLCSRQVLSNFTICHTHNWSLQCIIEKDL